MRLSHLAAMLLLAGGFAASSAIAKPPTDATGQCKDDSYTKSETREGACSSHGGVKAWYGKKASKASKADKAEKAAKADTAEKAAKADKAEKAAAKERRPSESTGSDRATNAQPTARPSVAAAGGGAGRVWVNTDSKVYHCEKDALYGKTKQGEYMSESQAKASGARASRGKECA